MLEMHYRRHLCHRRPEIDDQDADVMTMTMTMLMEATKL
jgi:hypothetical protein